VVKVGGGLTKTGKLRGEGGVLMFDTMMTATAAVETSRRRRRINQAAAATNSSSSSSSSSSLPCLRGAAFGCHHPSTYPSLSRQGAQHEFP
jgi:hypothetical protein